MCALDAWTPPPSGLKKAPCPVVSGLCGTWEPRHAPMNVSVGVLARATDVRGGNRMTQEAKAGTSKDNGKRLAILPLLQAVAER